MKKSTVKWIILIVLCTIALAIVPITYSKYMSTASDSITLNIRKPIYYIKYYYNNTLLDTQEFTYGTPQNIINNTQNIQGKVFGNWNTEEDGSGTEYEEGQEVNNLATVDGTIINLYAIWYDGVARIGSTYYSTLQLALSDVPTNSPQTTVELLANVSENLTVAKNQNINLDLRNHTVNVTADTLLDNYGTVTISNGILDSSSTNTATINNQKNASLTITGGQVIMSNPKGKQAIYNNGGTLEISGSAIIRSESNPEQTSNSRATVQNLNSGTLNITGGTIIASYFQGINNAATMSIGTKDGNVNRTSPVIQGATNGINSSTNFTFYDGIIKAKTAAINNETKVSDIETGYEIAHGEETIDSQLYKTAYLGITNTVTFNGNGGTSSEASRRVENGNEIGTLPNATRNGYLLIGWFTLAEGGTQIDAQTIVTSDITYFAHWQINYVAEVNGVKYTTLQAAINAVPNDNTQTVVTIVQNVSANIKTTTGQNIILDLQSFTLSNQSGVSAIENHGTLEIIHGNVTSNGTAATIDNREGTLKINGIRVTATGNRQAIYNYASGTVEISGNAYLSSSTTGKPTTTTLDRATVQNEAGATIVITEATIVCDTQDAIANEGTLTIGVKDGNINTSVPTMTGERYGINNIGTVNFYDGTAKGITSADTGTPSDIESNSQIASNTETIDGKTYITEYLEPTV